MKLLPLCYMELLTLLLIEDNIKPLGYQQYRHLVSEKKTNDPGNSRYFTYQAKVLSD